MPFPKLLARKRTWLGIVVLLVLATLYLYTQYTEGLEGEEPQSELPVFQWIPVQNLTQLSHCRNSQQGHSLIVDELGYVCQLPEVQSSGCCQSSRRYECSSCQDTGCCAVYEHCVSCCLHPDKQPLLRSILTRSTENFHPLYSSLKDQFELCLTKCRTSSQSVQHENSYRNPRAKYCYGTSNPVLLPEENARPEELEEFQT